jgi:hypothetical protein
MNLRFLFLFVFMSSNLVASPIEDLRRLFDSAIKNEQSAKLLLQQSASNDIEKNTLLGYKAATQMIMAKFYFNPWKKLQTFNSGKGQLETAIQIEPNNIELIFLRYMIQKNSPSFLQYNNSIASDKKILLLSINNLKDQDLKSRISNYLKTAEKP